VQHAFRLTQRHLQKESSERFQIDLSIGEPPIEAHAPANSPNVIEKDFGWTPVGDPSEDYDALGEQLTEGRLRQCRAENLAEADADPKHSNADDKRPTPDAKEIAQIAL
jgi:hypothetical protein